MNLTEYLYALWAESTIKYTSLWKIEVKRNPELKEKIIDDLSNLFTWAIQKISLESSESISGILQIVENPSVFFLLSEELYSILRSNISKKIWDSFWTTVVSPTVIHEKTEDIFPDTLKWNYIDVLHDGVFASFNNKT